MDFRMVEVKETVIYGVSKEFDGTAYSSREALRSVVWSEDCDNAPGRIAESRWNEQGSHGHCEIWAPAEEKQLP